MGNTPVATWKLTGTFGKIGKVVGSMGIVGLALGFVLKYVFHYYLNYSQSGFYQYWPKRGWLLLYITGGMLALLS